MLNGSNYQRRYDLNYIEIYKWKKSLNDYKVTPDQIVGPKGNKEFTDLVTIMGCNIGNKFDMNKLQFDKIIISSDADKQIYVRNKHIQLLGYCNKLISS